MALSETTRPVVTGGVGDELGVAPGEADGPGVAPPREEGGTLVGMRPVATTVPEDRDTSCLRRAPTRGRAYASHANAPTTSATSASLLNQEAHPPPGLFSPIIKG